MITIIPSTSNNFAIINKCLFFKLFSPLNIIDNLQPVLYLIVSLFVS